MIQTQQLIWNILLSIRLVPIPGLAFWTPNPAASLHIVKFHEVSSANFISHSYWWLTYKYEKEATPSWISPHGHYRGSGADPLSERWGHRAAPHYCDALRRLPVRFPTITLSIGFVAHANCPGRRSWYAGGYEEPHAPSTDISGDKQARNRFYISHFWADCVSRRPGRRMYENILKVFALLLLQQLRMVRWTYL